LTLVAGALEVVLSASVNLEWTAPATTQTVTVQLFIDGVQNTTDTFKCAGTSGGSYSRVFKTNKLAGAHTFDLQVFVNDITSAPTASGALTVIATP
jgi:sulfatase maturation enzyme AslB (radical SAM superfamily)